MARLKAELTDPEGIRWSWQHDEHLHHLMGLRRLEVPVSRPRALSEAIGGDFQYLRNSEGGEMAKGDRQSWAVNQLVDVIDAEVARLEALRAGLDFETLELDRSEAPARAMFETSKDAILARKYEAANERALYRALKEFREINAMPAEVASQQELEADPADGLASPQLDLPEEVEESRDVDQTSSEGGFGGRSNGFDAGNGADRGLDGVSEGPESLKRAV